MAATGDRSDHARAVLLHPAVLIALVLLALNDHLLRHLWPSSFTGKLGDFAWLFFMSLVAAALLEIVGQGRPARGRRLAGLAGFGLVSGIFALAETVPACHAAVVAAATDLFSFPVGWRRDPTDLIALVALAPAWLLWQRTAPRPTKNRLAGVIVMARAEYCWKTRRALRRESWYNS